MFRNIYEKLKDISINRLIIVFTVIVLMFFYLIVKLFNLQIIDYAKVEDTEEQEIVTDEEGYYTITTTSVPARGLIYDRNGNVLAYNEIQYNLDFFNTASLSTNDERNAAIYALINILEEHNLEKEFSFPMEFDEEGNLIYTVEDNALKRFLKNCYGLPSANDLTEEQLATTPQELFDYLRYGNDITSMFGISDTYTDEEALQIMDYRYQLYINNPSYSSIRLVSDITEEFRIEILENQSIIPCVEISKSYKRIYNDAIYFAHIIGYVGAINETELAAFEEEGSENYTEDSIVGKLGVEKSYDSYLQGTIGQTEITVNSSGQVVSKKVISEPIDGNDLYLTIDRASQIAGYYVVEKNIASILMSAIVNSYSYGSVGSSADDITIPIYEVYSSLVTNSVIDIESLDGSNATDTEKKVYSEFSSSRNDIYSGIEKLLQKGNATAYNDLSSNNKDYMDFIYSSLRGDWAVVTKNIDTSADYFKSYLNGNSSMAEFLMNCIENGNVDTSVLNLESGYYDSNDVYDALLSFILDKLNNDTGFDKQIYRNLIFDGVISGRDLCIILYDQGVIEEDSYYNGLINYTISAYDFVMKKINSLEITPAMLALKPCSGSLVVTDPNSGDVIAMVSYPSYDNNKLTNQIDYDYYTKLYEDESYPMLCRATQSKTTTGSTFKPLTSILALTEGTITTDTYIHDSVKFTSITPSPSCWSTSGHGTINVTDAIYHSCNYFFFTVAYKFSKNSRGDYSDEQGLKLIQKYAAKFGFDSVSGVEISESDPEISNTDAVRTSIGYYHNFAPIQIARYATTIANSGTCYNLTLIDSVKTKDGSVVFENEPSVYNTLDEVAESSWNAVHQGMYKVVNSSSSLKTVFRGLSVTVAGKTGTAQVSLNQPNNALFISYAPYSDPEVCVTVVLPNGYKSANAAATAAEFYKFYFDGTNADNLLSGNVYAGEAENIDVGD
jgi:penicillin-binding protein 2